MRVLAGDAASSLDQLIPTAGAAVESIYVATFWIPPGHTAASREFTTRFQAMTHRLPSAGEALTYDAVMLLASAARTMGPERDLVRQYLQELGDSRPPYDGVTGQIAFGEERRPRRIIIARVRRRLLESVPWQ
jgi:ABC-type branched-subunit amino acid transport system substrate-binding protein